jgi:signal transduction histidine kinase
MLGFLANDRVIAPERKAGYLWQMTEKARQLVTALDEIVWAVNPRYDSLASLAGYYSLYAQRFLSLASLACHLEIAERLPDCPLDSKVRHSLFLAFKEALNNVVRHAEASEVRLRILVEDDELIVAVTDNGRGLQPAAVTEAGMDGLANMRARMSALGGRCEIRSAPAQGTTVLFGVRLSKDDNDQSSHN